MAGRKESRFGRVMSIVVDESPLWVWITGFFVIIFVFGFLYALLSPFGHGMEVVGEQDVRFDFGRGLYFSVVTVSSLGYGDLHPEGAGKLLAGIEVLLGLGLIGIVIAKLTSKRVSHFVSRLFVSETKRQLQSFNALFDTRRAELSALLEEVSRVYQQTPGADAKRPESTVVERSLRSSLDRLQESSVELQEYIQAEGLDRSYFALAPTSSLVRLADAVEEALFYLGQSIVSFPVRSNPSILDEVLTHVNRRKLDRVVNTLKATSLMIIEGRRIDPSVQDAFERINALCTDIDGLLLPVGEQPDQVIQTS